jgi:hypothetical protein
MVRKREGHLPMILLVCAFRLVTATAGSGTPSRPGRPNVVVIVMDDLRPMFEAFGYGAVAAPHMNALANESMVFRSAYVQQAVCG